MNLTHKIIKEHLIEGRMEPGQEIGLRIDQTLTQDATGTMACLQWEAMGLDRVQTDLSVSYVDHNTLQMGFKNPDDHRYLRSVAQKYGLVFSPPGTGICHQLHLENFARPGTTLVGSDSHTPTAGGVCSLAMGAGGLSVALAMAGEPYVISMPRVVNVRLEGNLTGWASAKDIILYLLSRLGVKGGVGKVMEYTGPGVAGLTVPERATITNMGAELGATASIFPADENTRAFLRSMGREEEFVPLAGDPDAEYDESLAIDLSRIVPMAAKPHMPDLGVPVSELDGICIDQAAIGSCTNSSYADLKTAASILSGRKKAGNVDLLISPGSKQVLNMLMRENLVWPMLKSGGRLLECACGPCIGMGGSPVSRGVSVRTFNRNFEGRSGTKDARVYLASPATAAFAAINGRFTDPDTWGAPFPRPELPAETPSIRHMFVFPGTEKKARIERGPNIVPLPEFEELPPALSLSVSMKVGDDITTDHILPGGAEVTSLRSNIPAISEYIFSRMDPDFAKRALSLGQSLILGAENYGQGSSREHAALAPRYLGIRAVVVKSFARIHRANLVNFGILPLILADPNDYDRIGLEDTLKLDCTAIKPGQEITAQLSSGQGITLANDLTAHELEVIRAGGLLNRVRKQKKNPLE
ncbi:MAG: aconitate hydratase [Desulfonatronovibrionaceae bacterium]